MSPIQAEGEADWTHAAELSEFGSERRLTRSIAGIDLLLLRLENQVLAVRNRCTHLGQPLDRGRVMAGQIMCPFHGACFDLRSGAALSGPAVLPLACYPVRIVDGRVEVQLPPAASGRHPAPKTIRDNDPQEPQR